MIFAWMSVIQYFAIEAVVVSSAPSTWRPTQLSRNTRATVASVLHSASTNWVFWNSMIFWPNASRSLTETVGSERALDHGRGMGRDDEPLLGQLAHELGEALALLGAEQAFGRQRDILEEQFG